jgi:Flp pilus assembly protein TadG
MDPGGHALFPAARPPRDAERGAIAILSALVLIVVGAFLALSLNVGNIMNTRAATQGAVDSAALAGALSLDGSTAGLTAAATSANAFATSHYLNRDQVVLTPGTDIQTGRWSFSASTFTASADPLLVNAVRATAGRDTSGMRNSPLPVYFGVFLGGRTSVNVHSSAVAAGGGPASGCSIPIVLAACTVQPPGGGSLCGQHLVFGNANIDNVGWTNLAPGSRSVNNQDIADILNGTSGGAGCATDPASGLPCCPVKVDDSLAVGNGNNLNDKVEKAFKTPSNGPAGGYVCAGGVCPYITVPVVDVGCPGGNPAFTGVNPVVGFATFQIMDVGAHPRHLDIVMQCDRTSTEPPGGGSFGTKVLHPRLVQ